MVLAEEKLIQQFKHGNKNSFEEIVNIYYQKVYSTCYRYLGHTEEAADACQDVFLKIYLNLEKFRKGSSLSTWIYQITSNTCRDLLRKKKDNLKSLDKYDYQIKDQSVLPEKQTILNENQQALQKIINQLSLNYKEVLILRDFEGLNYEEIASTLNISMGTVKSRLSRARSFLREEFKKYQTGGGVE